MASNVGMASLKFGAGDQVHSGFLAPEVIHIHSLQVIDWCCRDYWLSRDYHETNQDCDNQKGAEMGRAGVFLQISEQLDMLNMVEGALRSFTASDSPEHLFSFLKF